MSRANDMVYPCHRDDAPNNTVQCGLTIREHFAAMAMQGLLAYFGDEEQSSDVTARGAVHQADALIAELAKVRQ